MSPFKTSPFQDLEGKADPAWLWDYARGRIVWANRAGIAFWGEATLFDLLDHRFDPGGATVKKIREIAKTASQSGAQSNEVIFFPEAGQLVKCTCRITGLEGERKGLLVAARRTGGKGQEAGGELFAQVVNSSPFAIGVFDRAGRLIYGNAALGEVFSNTEPETGNASGNSFHLARWMGSEDEAHSLISRILLVGSHSAAQMMETRFGARTHRLTARRMSLEEGETAILIYFHDIEDRRRYELELESRLANLETRFQNLPEPEEGEVKTTDESDQAAEEARSDEAGIAAPPPALKTLEPVQERAGPEGVQPTGAENQEESGDPEAGLPSPARETAGEDESGKGAEKADAEKADKVGLPEEAEKTQDEDGFSKISLETIEMPSIPEASQPLAPADIKSEDLTKTPAKETDAAEKPTVRPKAELFDSVTLSPTKRQTARPEEKRTPRSDLKGRDREAFSAIAQALRANSPVALETLDLSQKREEIALVDSTDTTGGDGETEAEKTVVSPPASSDTGSVEREESETVKMAGESREKAGTAQIVPDMTLKESEARVSELQAILDSAADGIITLDSEGRICSLNTASETILGRKKEEVRGTTFTDLLSTSSAREVESYLEAVTETGVVGVFRDGREIEAKRPDDSRIPLFLTLGRVKSDETLQYCAVIRDISQW
ncbi:MAG TPA: PAS domain S-box protein, partial [Rhizobiales bacterium]|nr:PAS domain S-box protein [Hyphomicrobiales bacterium]